MTKIVPLGGKTRSTERNKTDFREQARTVAAFLDLANHIPIDPDFPVTDQFFQMLCRCVGPHEQIHLRELRADPRPECRYHLDAAAHALANVIYEGLCEDAHLSAALACGRGEAIPSYGDSYFDQELKFDSVNGQGKHEVYRVKPLSAFDEVRQRLTPGRIRFCDREECRALFYAAREDGRWCSQHCGEKVRHAAKARQS
jgi:hypothetical protein